LEFIILGLLHEPRSGYDLKAEFDAGAAHFWAAEYSQIYATLKRMRARGWLRERRASSTKGPPRRLYERTREGRRALLKWLRGTPQFGDERYAFVAQVYFLGEVEGVDAQVGFLRRLRTALAERLAALRAVDQAWARASPEYPDRLPDRDFFPAQTLRLGLRTAEARLAWCDEMIELVEKRARRKEVTS
jgi:PadR family transcriptional regulator AphA